MVWVLSEVVFALGAFNVVEIGHETLSAQRPAVPEVGGVWVWGSGVGVVACVA